MKMESAIPFIAMVIQQLAQVGLLVATKAVTSAGLTTFTFLFYSSFFSTLILNPVSFFLHSFLMQVFTYVGLLYSSPLLSSAILQLIPGFTFILAILLRMETFEYKSWCTVAKTIGTLVSIIGALVATLYKGPDTFVLKKYPAQLLVMLFYSCNVTLLSLAVFGNVFQVSINSWCMKRRGPLFVVMFHPLGIVFAMAASLFMGETIPVGSLVGSVIIVVGFYSVIWGKAKEREEEVMSLRSNNKKKMVLLPDKTDDS
ncbi:unnamed protein product [Withania somnifera]